MTIGWSSPAFSTVSSFNVHRAHNQMSLGNVKLNKDEQTFFFTEKISQGT